MVSFAANTRVRFMYGDLLVSVGGLGDTILYLDKLIRRSTNLAPAFEHFQSYWFDSIQQVFEAGGDPVPWPELTEAYAANYHGGDTTPTLRLSDRLWESLTSQTSDTIWQVGPRHIEFGSRVPYFEFHQEGRGNNPQREMLVLTDDAARQLLRVVSEFVETGRLV